VANQTVIMIRFRSMPSRTWAADRVTESGLYSMVSNISKKT